MQVAAADGPLSQRLATPSKYARQTVTVAGEKDETRWGVRCEFGAAGGNNWREASGLGGAGRCWVLGPQNSEARDTERRWRGERIEFRNQGMDV